MGKGDKKTRKGKIAKGSFGVLRPKPAHKRRSPPAGGQLQEEPKTRRAGPTGKK